MVRKLAAKFLIGLGVVILVASGFLLWRRNDPSRLQFENMELSGEAETTGLAEPTGLVIESLQLKLPIIPAKNVGDTTADGVSYLTLSPKPGERGNSILYGHNWGSILGKLYKVKPGQKIEIYYSDGTVRRFEVAYTQEVTPRDTYVLNGSQDIRLTLYTCSGFLDQMRFVVTAFLV